MIDFQYPMVSVSQQSRILKLSRSSVYYQPAEIAPPELFLMRLIDEQYLRRRLSKDLVL